jgi:hypothetical protein
MLLGGAGWLASRSMYTLMLDNFLFCSSFFTFSVRYLFSFAQREENIYLSMLYLSARLPFIFQLVRVARETRPL